MRRILFAVLALCFALAPARAEEAPGLEKAQEWVAKIYINAREELLALPQATIDEKEEKLHYLAENIRGAADVPGIDLEWMTNLSLYSLEQVAQCMAMGAIIPPTDPLQSGILANPSAYKIGAVLCDGILPEMKELEVIDIENSNHIAYLWLVMVPKGESLQVGKKYPFTGLVPLLATGGYGYLDPSYSQFTWPGIPDS